MDFAPGSLAAETFPRTYGGVPMHRDLYRRAGFRFLELTKRATPS